MLVALYQLLIAPIEYLISAIFFSFYFYFFNVPLAIVGLSLVVQFMVLPLYKRADAIQLEEREKIKSMEKWVKHIKSHFSGDEKYMILNAYYAEQDYHPIYALRSSISLLLQVPFFIAAYHYLSGLSLLGEHGFWWIDNLGRPDSLWAIGGFSINLLPILMTVINCVAGYIYTKDAPAREKVQVYLLALFFLILLYNSPSGLVLYWTFNNIFSLCKNIVAKYVSDEDKIIAFILSLLGFGYVIFGYIKGTLRTALFSMDTVKLLQYAVIFSLLELPLAYMLLRDKRPEKKVVAAKDSYPESSIKRVLLIEALLVLLIGAWIPLSVVSASPLDFVNVYDYINPLHYVVTNLLVASGVFLIWANVIYAFLQKKHRFLFEQGLFAIFSVMLFDFLLWGRDHGRILSDLVFEKDIEYTRFEKIGNLILCIILAVLAAWVWKRFHKKLAVLLGIVLLSVAVLCGNYLIRSGKELSTVKIPEKTEQEVTPILPLSKDGHNVVVIMLDRAINGYIPYIMNEKPELKEKFAGFTYYPNTVSFGGHTNFGAPPLYGGYDYTPKAMNERPDESLMDKHDEALKMMPMIFSDAGYEVTVCDPPYAGYQEIPDLSIYDDLPGVNAYNVQRMYTSDFSMEGNKEQMERQFLFYSVFKSFPVVTQNYIYQYGSYMSFNTALRTLNRYVTYYSELKLLPELTQVKDSGDSFIILENDITHIMQTLQMPNYVPALNVNNSEYEDQGRFTLGEESVDMSSGSGLGSYHTNMAAMLKLGDWFDYLRANDLYDNTRIILVSDHGYPLGQFEKMIINDELDVEWFNPLLMVKDYDAEGFTVCDDFMTNADVPSLAVEGLIEDPANPFTDNPIDMKPKEDGADVTLTMNYNISKNNGNVFDTSDAPWYHVNNDIFDAANWEKMP